MFCLNCLFFSNVWKCFVTKTPAVITFVTFQEVNVYHRPLQPGKENVFVEEQSGGHAYTQSLVVLLVLKENDPPLLPNLLSVFRDSALSTPILQPFQC